MCPGKLLKRMSGIVMLGGLLLAPGLTFANHYGGTNYYQLVQQAKSAKRVEVIAQAESRQALVEVLASADSGDINKLLESSPTAAGGEAARVEEKQVVEKCYYSVQAVACKTKTVYQLVK
ncbi:hypothetical protein [Ferrimonas gelatinilytica]|uniref:DUF3316 domain-containing protein n=1 Tax=Ferrimonas gelatinilytica TaxID=1255257 RepID=A0ABP9S7Q0_9GAMM